jgi:glycosyltransferase involved in cell wall biosynthesis
MASGAPVIGANIGGIPELISHGEDGLLFPPGDASALARAIAALYGDRAQLGRFTSRLAEKMQRHTMGAYLELLMDVYAEAIAAHGRP